MKDWRLVEKPLEQEAALFTRRLVEVVKEHVRGRGEGATETAVSMCLGWALRLGLDCFGWSAEEAADFARETTQQIIDSDARGAS